MATNTLIFESQTISDDHIFGGVNYLADLNTGDEFTIGNTASASVSFVTDVRLPLYTKDSTNGKFSLTQGNEENIADNNDDQLVTDDNQLFAIETARGRFFITETTKSEGFYTVKAYDAMILLETSISALSLTFPLTVSAAATAIATYIGGSVSGTIYNGTLSVSALDEDMTIRELLSYVAEASGCSVKIDEGGRLCFMYYEDSGITLTASDYKKIEVADYTCAAIDNVIILNSVGAAIATAGSGTNTLYVDGNPFLEEATNTEAALLLSLVEGFEYAPLSCEMFDENELQVGTIATFGTTPTLVMHLESSEEGAIASSVGSDSRAEYNKSFETMLAAVTKEALDAAGEASTKATKYITKIDNAGIKVHAYNDSTKTPDDSNYAKINSNGMEVFKGGSSVAMYGDSARIGRNDQAKVVIQSSGIDMYGYNANAAMPQMLMCHIGYDSGNSGSGQAIAPYYTFGKRTGDIGNYSVVEGDSGTASGISSHAEGTFCQATTGRAHAEGIYTTASGGASHSEGSYTTTSGLYAHAEGAGTTASGVASHSEGNSTTASGDYSHASGVGTTASGEGQTVIGKHNIADTTSLFIIGKGTSSSPSNALAVDGSGNLTISGALIGNSVAKDVSSNFIPYSTAPFNTGTINAFQIGNLINVRYKLPAVSLNTSTTVALFSIYPNWRPRTEYIFQASITDANYTHIGTGTVRLQNDGWVYLRTPASMSQLTGLYIMFNGTYIH